jgi:hypothetical protein
MSRSALPLLLVAFFALVILGLGWFFLREGPAGSESAVVSGTTAVPAGAPESSDATAAVEPAAKTADTPASGSDEASRVAISGRTVHGFVKCEDGELPASEIRVYLLTREPRVVLPTTLEQGLLAQAGVNVDGSFEIGPLPGSSFYLYAEGGAYVQAETQHLDPADIGEPVILRVRRACAIEGLVHARDGAPVAGALVAVGNETDLMSAFGVDAEEMIGQYLEGSPESLDPESSADAKREATEAREALEAGKEQASVKSDAGGRFRFDRLKDEDGALITITAPGFAKYRQVIANLRPGKAVYVDAELETAGRLRGTVRDEAMQPIAGASVHALRSDKLLQGLLGGGLAYDRTRTDANGEFVLDHLAAGPYRVEARVKGWPPQLKHEVELAPGQEMAGVDFVVDPGAALTGRVVDASGAPVAEASVQAVEPPSLTDLLSFTRMMQADKPIKTDAEGRFEIRGLTKAKHTVTASADHHVEAKLTDVMPGGDPITLVLGTPGSITGVVVSTTTDEPVTTYKLETELQREKQPEGGATLNVTFNLDSLMDGGTRQHEKSVDDPQGRFLVEDLEPGTARIEVHAEHHAPAGLGGVPVKAGETTKGLILFLEPEGILEGKVIDAQTRQPIAASVTVNMDGDEERPAESGSAWHRFTPKTGEEKQADAEGKFVVAGLPRGTARVYAGHEGYQKSKPLLVTIAPGKTVSDLLIELSPVTAMPKGNVEGVVYTTTGKPRQGAMVFVSKRGTFDDMDDPVITDGRGSFEFQDLPAGRTNLMLISGDSNLNAMSFVSMFTKRKLVPIEVKANETVHVELREDGQVRKGCRVHGVARSGDQPASGAMIFAFAEQGHDGLKTATADDQGRYEIPDMAPGRWRFAVTQDFSAMTGGGGSGIPVTVPDAAELTQDLLVPQGKLTGRVVDAASRAPIPGVSVFAIPDELPPSSLLASAFDHDENVVLSDDSGAFTLPGLAPGSYTLRAGGPHSRGAAGEYAQGIVKGIVIASSGAAPVEIALSRGGVVSGTVRDQSGQAIAGVSVLLRDEAGNLVDSSRGVTTDGGGRYRYAGLPIGRCYLIAVWANEATQASDLFETGAGKEAVIDFTLTKGIPVTVRVTKLPSDLSFGEVEVTATDARGRVFRQIVTEEMLEAWVLGGLAPGEYRLGPYPPGEYKIAIRNGDTIVYSRSVTLKNPDGETFELDGSLAH